MIPAPRLSFLIPGLMGCLVFLAGPALGQEPPPTEIPHPLDEMAQETVFESPTRIEGRLLTFDTYDEAIWIEWTRVYNGVRWLYPPQGTQLLIYPRDKTMMDFFRALQPGAVLGMTIQRGQDGKRRVLELEGT